MQIIKQIQGTLFDKYGIEVSPTIVWAVPMLGLLVIIFLMTFATRVKIVDPTPTDVLEMEEVSKKMINEDQQNLGGF